MRVGFIITCFDREPYWPFLRRILGSYTVIRPILTYCYNGMNTEHPCDVRRTNLGHVAGDMDLILSGYSWLSAGHPNCRLHRFIKLSVDSWPCDERVLVSLFGRMEAQRACYGGNYWHHNVEGSLSTDIFLADTRYGNVFGPLTAAQGYTDSEIAMDHAVRSVGQAYLIPERHPVHMEHRWRCDALKWTMSHRLEGNIRWAARWGALAEAGSAVGIKPESAENQ